MDQDHREAKTLVNDTSLDLARTPLFPTPRHNSIVTQLHPKVKARHSREPVRLLRRLLSQLN